MTEHDFTLRATEALQNRLGASIELRAERAGKVARLQNILISNELLAFFLSQNEKPDAQKFLNYDFDQNDRRLMLMYDA